MNKWTCLLVVGLLANPLTALAESTPEAQKWIDGIATAYDRAPFQLELEGTMGGGSPMQGILTGDILIKDRSHQRVSIRIEMAGQGGNMQMGMLTVSDGTHTWTEVSSPMGKQVIKISLEEAKKRVAQGMGLGPGMGSMDPLAMTEQLSKTMDFELVGVVDGKATLQAKITEEDRAAFAGMQVDTITIVLDEKTGFPIRIEIGGAQPFLTMNLNNMKFVKESDLPDDAFSYTPPEGVPVMDGAQIMGRPPGGG